MATVKEQVVKKTLLLNPEELERLRQLFETVILKRFAKLSMRLWPMERH